MPLINISSLETSLQSVHSPSNRLRIIRISNILTIILFSYSNIYCAIFSNPTSGEIVNKYPTYFTPSLTFIKILWPILYFLQLGFVFYAQFFDVYLIQEVVGKVVSWWFSLSNLFMCGWLFFWMREDFVISEIFALLTLISTSVAQRRLIVEYVPNHNLIPTSVIAYLHIPFSMFSAFSWLTFIYNGFVILHQHYQDKVEYAILSAWAMTIIGIFWCITGIFSKGRRDFVYSFTTACLLIGVGIKQSEQDVYITCYILAITQFILILFTVIKNSRKRSISDDESGMLIQHRMNFYGGIIVDNWYN